MLVMRPSSAAASWVVCEWARSTTPPSPTTPRPGAPRLPLGWRQVRAASVDPDVALAYKFPEVSFATKRGASHSSTERLSRLIPSVTPSPYSVQERGAVRARHGGLRR
ncbi:hypothetical protein VPH35_030732 [Triticum aestivum]